ncbi:MAG: hypothetical protein U0L20_06325 [Ruminococcus sp.]|nr:hypothetical protein [Ruminococcus sp.]
MNCELIFYTARKTSFCERSLQKSFSELDLTLKNVFFAHGSMQLGELLNEAFQRTDIVFIIGNLGLYDDRSVEAVLSRAMSSVALDEYRKVKNDLGDDGYVFRLENQLLIVLPDEPQQIEVIMQGPLGGYVKKRNIARV